MTNSINNNNDAMREVGRRADGDGKDKGGEGASGEPFFRLGYEQQENHDGMAIAKYRTNRKKTRP